MQPTSPVTASLSPWEPGIFSLALYSFMVLVLIAVLLFLSTWLEEKKPPEKIRPYECGIIPTGPARFRYPVPFYLVAIFFLIFDVETVFIFTWSVAFKQLSWAGWLEIFSLFLCCSSVFFSSGKKEGLSGGQQLQKA